ncbi:OmpA family protein [Sphingomonas sanguinis]|uniref:OmpA family protein n=1 Tax=Sphingomonas sp. LC-1 TaxID=3110957 RepID=UPI0021BAD9F8|nr:OmpA family protein [Sphingomonas sp. LC-1]MCT8001076.1 OmpA family protein [Sphingomonas sp. LC-1]
MRPMALVAIAGLALTGCDSRDTTVARAAGANGASIELPVPDPSPSADTASPTPAGPDTLPGEVAANPGASLSTIGFPQGGDALDREARTALDRVAADPRVRSGRIVLRGHSDSEGDDEANRRMSRKRAEAVRDYLAGKGIARTAMTVIALGETRPIAPNARPDGSDDSAGRARNRRVEIALASADRP